MENLQKKNLLLVYIFLSVQGSTTEILDIEE